MKLVSGELINCFLPTKALCVHVNVPYLLRRQEEVKSRFILFTLLSAGDVSRETPSAAKREEKWLFSQARQSMRFEIIMFCFKAFLSFTSLFYLFG